MHSFPEIAMASLDRQSGQPDHSGSTATEEETEKKGKAEMVYICYIRVGN